MHNRHLKPCMVDNLASAFVHHESIIDFAILCGYEANLNGICYGIGVMASQAQLSGPGEFTRFNRRLALMPAIACLIEEDLIKQWYIVCENPEKYITKNNIFTRKKRMVANHYKDGTDRKLSNFSDLMKDLSYESQTGIAEQALYTATIQSSYTETIESSGPWFSVRGTIFKSDPHDEKICEETAEKIRERIRVMIETINAKIDGIAINEQMTKRDKKIFDQLNLQKDALNDLQTLKNDEIINLIRETPAFLEGAYAYASSNSYAEKIKIDILQEATNPKDPLDESIIKAIDNVNTSRQSWELVQYYHASDAVMTKGGMHKGFKYIDKFTNEKLTDFFDEYKKVLGESAGLCAFNIFAPGHAISGGFDPVRGERGQYWLIDANQLPVKYFDTADEFSAAIMGCFRSNVYLKDSVVLGIEAVHVNEENKNENFTKKLNQFKSGFLQNLSEQRQAYFKEDIYGYDYGMVELLILIASEFIYNYKVDDAIIKVTQMLNENYGINEENEIIKIAIWGLKVKFGDQIIELSERVSSLYTAYQCIFLDILRYISDGQSISGQKITILDTELQDTRSLLSEIISSWKKEENSTILYKNSQEIEKQKSMFQRVRERLESIGVDDIEGKAALRALSLAYPVEGGNMEEKPGEVKHLLKNNEILIREGLDAETEAAINALSLEQEKSLADIARHKRVMLQQEEAEQTHSRLGVHAAEEPNIGVPKDNECKTADDVDDYNHAFNTLNQSIQTLEERLSSDTILSIENKTNISICIDQTRHLATQIDNELQTDSAQKPFLIECLIKTNELLSSSSPEALKAYHDFARDSAKSASPVKRVIAGLMIPLGVAPSRPLKLFPLSSPSVYQRLPARDSLQVASPSKRLV